MINNFNEVRECIYKGEHYSVRDNGAIMRHVREGKRVRIDDGVWTFGVKNSQNGYMFLGQHRVHIVVATAFHGARDSKIYVVDHIDTNRCNNRPDNLRWFTKIENALNNEITRHKIIYFCGSIEAFVENPSILRECIVGEPSLEWMKTVSKEDAAIAYENIKKYWKEQAENPKPLAGGKLDERVYHKQKNLSLVSPILDDASNKFSSQQKYVVSDSEWPQLTDSLRRPYENGYVGQDDYIQEQEKKRYILSLTPRAGQIKFFYDDKPFEYPTTPQGEYENPLQVYADALKENTVFCRSHGGKREYLVYKCNMSSDGQSLIVMTKTGYVWRSNGNGDIYEARTTELNNDEYSENELSFSINKVDYRDNLYIHERISGGFMPKEYLDEQYLKMTEKK